MANSRVLFSDLKTGKPSYGVDARVLRLWDVRSSRRGGELTGLDMLLIDVSGIIIQARISADRIPIFRPRLTAGSVYYISGFDVCQCAKQFRFSDSSLMIRFNESTYLDELLNPFSALPVDGFRFCDKAELFGLANTNSRLPDVVGELSTVKSTVRDPLKGKNHVMAKIKLDDGGSFTLSLFDSQAISFHRRLESMSVDPKVIIATNINPRMVGGRLFLNGTPGTHLCLDGEASAGHNLYNRLVTRDCGLLPTVPLLGAIPKAEPLTVHELNKFAVTSLSEEIEFMCIGRITRVNCERGWCYVACSKCSRELHRSTSAFTCVRCENDHAVGVLRYRVELAVADDNAEGVFVCFDGVMTNLHRLEAREAGDMLAEEGVNPEASPVPLFISNMEGKTYAFQVRLATYNFTATRQTFTVTRILDGDSRNCCVMRASQPIHSEARYRRSNVGRYRISDSAAIGGVPMEHADTTAQYVKRSRLT